MDSAQFKKYGHEIVDWAVKYMTTLDKRMPTTDEKPGWMWKREVVSREPPEHPEPFEKILKDLEPVCLHGMAHWQHPQFFAYFPAGNSWPSVLGNVLSNAVGSNGSTWYSCPVITELEIIVMDWCCKFLGLPTFFLSSFSNPSSEGQGILQCSASEAIFYSLIWARQDALRKLRKKHPNKPKAVLLNMLVAYCNNECHCCVERAALMACVRMRKLKADPIGVIRSHTLRHAIHEDMEKGLVPFFHCAIIGSTGVTCSDDLMEVGPLCKKFDMWLHVDAAYAGSSFCLPELNFLKQGYEYVWSTNINTNKWMLCNFEASLHWVRFRRKAVDAFAGDSNNVLKYKNGLGPDLKHYGVASSRRFRAVKLWYVIRNYGVDGIRRYIRNHINLARLFETYVRRDSRFEVCGGPFRYGLVTFRLKGYNSLTSKLIDALNASRKIHMVPSHFHDMVVIRFALCAEHANERDVDRAWRTVDEFATAVLRQYRKEHADDLAMKWLLEQQDEHDHVLEDEPDPEFEREEAEAEEVLKHLDETLLVDSLLLGVDTAAVDGSWDYSDTDKFRMHDKRLSEHPQYDQEHDGEKMVDQVCSMLHFETLKEIIAHSPDHQFSLMKKK